MGLKNSRIVLMLIALALLMAACAPSAAPSATPAPSATQATTPEATQTPAEATQAPQDEQADDVQYPITVKHAFGESIIESKPERIAAISWGNLDVPLALGVVPVGVSEGNYGVTDDTRLLPWSYAGFQALGEETPNLYSDAAGLDFEAISDSQPDVILAAYSGLTQEEYDLLSKIAPVVAYPTLPWQTYWRDQIKLDAEGMGMKAEGEQLVTDLEALIADKLTAYPQIEGKSAAFFYFVPSDLGMFYVYLSTDPRAAFLQDLGMTVPQSVRTLEETSDSFALEISAENADILADVDIIVAYGDDAVLKSLQADPLLKTIPAIERGSVVMLQDNSPLAAAATPSALSIPATIDEYLTIIGEAATKAQ